MALGGSFPELLTATIGLFLGEGGMQAGSGTKIGSIVGSAVFNILFVIAISSLFVKEPLR